MFAGRSRARSATTLDCSSRQTGATLFLDEIAEMPAEAQAKVLRVIQEGEVRRLGDSGVRPVDVRIVTATNRDLSSMVGKGGFRQDLLYRLKGYVVALPPLRDRGRDVVSLARQFLRDTFPSKRISREAEAVLLTYKWPGNVRELQNVIRAAGIDVGRTIRPEHLAGHLDHAADSSAPSSSRADQILAVVDRIGSASSREIRNKMSLPRTRCGERSTTWWPLARSTVSAIASVLAIHGPPPQAPLNSPPGRNSSCVTLRMRVGSLDTSAPRRRVYPSARPAAILASSLSSGTCSRTVARATPRATFWRDGARGHLLAPTNQLPFRRQPWARHRATWVTSRRPDPGTGPPVRRDRPARRCP